jgi:aspartyl/glutamyl-tRNA(Asn/Gln) amidotransferase C subunit
MIDINEVRRIMSLIMLEDDPQKYIDDLIEILRLFDELDKYDKYIEGVEPLYHPLKIKGSPREDKVEVSRIDILELNKRVVDGYVVSSPIRGIKRLDL